MWFLGCHGKEPNILFLFCLVAGFPHFIFHIVLHSSSFAYNTFAYPLLTRCWPVAYLLLTFYLPLRTFCLPLLTFCLLFLKMAFLTFLTHYFPTIFLLFLTSEHFFSATQKIPHTAKRYETNDKMVKFAGSVGDLLAKTQVVCKAGVYLSRVLAHVYFFSLSQRLFQFQYIEYSTVFLFYKPI